MALPPKGDPRRPLHQAVRTTRFLGIGWVLVGACAVIPLLARMGLDPGIPAPARVVLFRWIFYLVPGTLFLVFSLFMRRRRFWAVLGALIVVSLINLSLVAMAVGILVALVAQRQARPLTVFAVLAVWAVSQLAGAQLLYRLARSFEAIKLAPFGQEESRGFEPLRVTPARKVKTGQGPFARAPHQRSSLGPYPGDPPDGPAA
jgi:hypothetical protein